MAEQNLIEKYGLEQYIQLPELSRTRLKPLKLLEVPNSPAIFGIESASNAEYQEKFGKLLEKNREKRLEYEKERIEQQKNSYPFIDLSFLKMVDKKTCFLLDPGGKLSEGWWDPKSVEDQHEMERECFIIADLPLFSIHKLNYPDFMFYGNIVHEKEKFWSFEPYAGLDRNYVTYEQGSSCVNIEDDYIKSNYHNKFSLYRLRSYLEDKKLGTFEFLNTTEKIMWNIQDKEGFRFSLTSRFNGLIPATSKERIFEAGKCFESLEKTYIIKEAQWVSGKLKELPLLRDPLVVAIDTKLSEAKKARLIDVFNATSLEDYVSREFTKENLDIKKKN